ncbi:MAG: hypothetical protein ACE5E0_02770 [Terriglobia bacterium]
MNRKLRSSVRGLAILLICAWALGLLGWVNPVVAGEHVVSSTSLVSDPERYDGRTVVFEGEVIGDVMVRGEAVWLTLNDDEYSRRGPSTDNDVAGYNTGLGVFIASDQFRQPRFTGDYRHRGDIVRVKGVFNRACEQHGGAMDLHGEESTVIRIGHRIEHPVSSAKIGITVLLAIVSVGVFLTNHFLIRKGRPGSHQSS